METPEIISRYISIPLKFPKRRELISIKKNTNRLAAGKLFIFIINSKPLIDGFSDTNNTDINPRNQPDT